MRSFRAPTQEEAATMQEAEDAAIEYVGLNGKKFVHFNLYTLGLALILNDPALKGWGNGR
jgi:hypothetical protein